MENKGVLMCSVTVGSEMMRRYDNTSHEAVPTPQPRRYDLASCVPGVSEIQWHGQCTRHNVNTQTENCQSLVTLIKITSLINTRLIELHSLSQWVSGWELWCGYWGSSMVTCEAWDISDGKIGKWKCVISFWLNQDPWAPAVSDDSCDSLSF